MKKLVLLSALVLFSSSWSLAQTSSAQPPNGMSEVAAYSIFLGNYKNESYEGAIRFGRWMWKGMPETIEGYSGFDLERNLDRLITAYGKVTETTADPSLREAYIDTALIIYDKVFDHFSKDEISYYDWYLSRGRFYQTYSSMVENAEAKSTEDYLKAFELSPEKLTKLGNGYYVQSILQGLVSQNEKEKALGVIKKSEPYASSQLQGFYDDIRQKLFDSPEEQIAFLESELKDNPKNEEVLRQLLTLYQNQEMYDKAADISQKLYDINPSYENTMALAEMAISNADYDMAIRYLKEAMDKAENAEQKAQIAIQISDAYLNQEQLQDAREYARMAIDFDSDWGVPYIQIADIYARAVNQCTNNRKMTPEDKVVYWLVLDYLDQAEQVDPDVANEVQRKYQAYEPVTLTTTEKFFWNPPLETGQDIAVDASLNECYGWINETTTVR
ncbi:MAG TPA: hypothetical protein VF181_10230 [Balneolaceae bacterium]